MSDAAIYFIVSTIIFIGLIAVYIFVPAKYYMRYVTGEEIMDILLFTIIAFFWPIVIPIIIVIVLFFFLMDYREKVQSKYK